MLIQVGRSMRCLVVAALLLLGGPLEGAFAWMPVRQHIALRADGPAERSGAPATLASVEVPFMANEGQLDGRVAFCARTFAGSVFVTRAGELVYSLPALGGEGAGMRPGWTLVERFRDGCAGPRAGPRAATHVSTFLGDDPTRWRSDVPTCATVELGEVWPGVEVGLRAHAWNVEKIYRVGAGAAIEPIRMELAGALALRIEADGALTATTELGEVRFRKPEAYQLLESGRVEVEAAYRLDGSGYGFELGAYDARSPVVIDPLLQSTYLGGSDQDRAQSLFVTSNAVYITGVTFWTNFPGTTGGAQPTAPGGVDAFVARLDLGLTTLVQATYLGGTDLDVATTISVTGTEVFVAGDTFSSDFPGTAGGAQPNAGGGSIDGFVVRFNLALTTLNQATYFGGNSVDRIRSLLLNGSDVFVTGHTGSTNLPGVAGGAQPTYGGGGLDGDGYVAKLNAALTTLNQSTFLGGSASDAASSLALMGSDLFVAGETQSSNFPGTAGGAQPSTGGGVADAFVARLDLALTTLNQATYLGGSGFDAAYPIVATASQLFLAGETGSTSLPGTSGAAQPSYGGGQNDAFLARLNLALTTLNKATYLGGNDVDFIGPDNPRTLVVAGSEVFLAGTTASTNFPGTSGGIQPSHGGGFFDAYAVRLNSSLTALNQATYLGGNANDVATSFFLSGTDLYVAGIASSTNFPGAAGGAQSFLDGPSDAFVARMTYDLSGCAVPDGLDAETCCSAAALVLPAIPRVTHTMRSVCFQDCGVRIDREVCVKIGAPQPEMIGGNPVCGVYLVPFSISTCDGPLLPLTQLPRPLWSGTLRAQYSRNWMASSVATAAPNTEVWRFLVNGDLSPSSYLLQYFSANPAIVPPCASAFGNRVQFSGYLDYSRNCRTSVFSAAWALNHDCDAFEHGSASDRQGAFHPQLSYTFVGPAKGFVVDPSMPPLSSGQIVLDAIRKNDWAASPAICTREEPLQGVTDFGIPLCPCGSGGSQYMTEFLQGQGACGTSFVVASSPPIPLVRKRIGRWTSGAIYPGIESLFLEQGYLTYVDACGPTLPDLPFFGVETIGGFPAFRVSPAMTPLGPHFKDLGSANRSPTDVSPLIGAPYVTHFVLNMNL